MKRFAFLFALLATAAVLAGACSMQGGDEPQVGKMRSESKSVDPKEAQSVRARLKMGAGELNLTGDYAQSFDSSIQGGVGEATVELPSEVGVKAKARGGLGKIDAEGLKRVGDSYVNDAYGESDVTLNVKVQGGVGEINLEVV